MKTIKTLIALALALLTVAALAAAPASAGVFSGLPKLVQVSYDESDDGSSPRFSLQAYAYRADKVRFTAHYDGDRAIGMGRYDDSVTDTNINANGEARHPWELIRKGDGKQVLKLIDRALSDRGKAKLRIHLITDNDVQDTKLTIELSDCSQDPPFYPVSCEVEA